MLAAIRIEKVTVTGESIVLGGLRTVLPGVPGSTGVSYAVNIVIQLNGADATTVLPTLENQIFYESLPEAFQNIPVPWKWYMPANFSAAHRPLPGPVQSPAEPASEAHFAILCAGDSQWQYASVSKIAGSKPEQFKELTPPVLKHEVTPEYPQTAMEEHAQGNVNMNLIVNIYGKPVQAWILSDPGYGLADSTITAIAKTTFEPGLYHGKTCAVVIPFKTDYATD